MTRDIAEKFNLENGPVFPLPEALIHEEVMVIPGLDGAKMSKSYGNTIEIFGDEATTKKKIMSIKTGSETLGTPLDPDTCLVIQLHRIFGNPAVSELESQYRSGSIGYGHAKIALFGYMWEYFRAAREKREELVKNPDYVAQVLARGAAQAGSYADQKLHQVRQSLGIES